MKKLGKSTLEGGANTVHVSGKPVLKRGTVASGEIRLQKAARLAGIMTAGSVAVLTIYDMCKAVDKRVRITGIRLVSKTKTGIQYEEKER